MAKKSPVIAETKKQGKKIAEGKGAKGHVRQVMGAVVDVQFDDELSARCCAQTCRPSASTPSREAASASSDRTSGRRRVWLPNTSRRSATHASA
jgi:hypothetical protein